MLEIDRLIGLYSNSPLIWMDMTHLKPRPSTRSLPNLTLDHLNSLSVHVRTRSLFHQAIHTLCRSVTSSARTDGRSRTGAGTQVGNSRKFKKTGAWSSMTENATRFSRPRQRKNLEVWYFPATTYATCDVSGNGGSAYFNFFFFKYIYTDTYIWSILR